MDLQNMLVPDQINGAADARLKELWTAMQVDQFIWPQPLFGADELAEEIGFVCKEGDYERAKELLLKSIEICDQEMGETHTGSIAMVRGAASLNICSDYWVLVENLFADRLRMCERNLDANDPDIFRLMESQAFSIRLTGDLAGAEAKLHECLSERERALGLANFEVIRTVQYLVQLMTSYGHPERAAEFRRQELLKRGLSPSDSDREMYALRGKLASGEWREPELS